MARYFKRDIPFLKYRKVFFIVSGALIVLSILGLIFKGMTFGIDFVGGTSISFNDTGDVTIEQMREAFEDAGASNATVQTSETNGKEGFIVRLSTTDAQEAAGYAQTVAAALDLSLDSYDVTTVGPDWGKDVTRTSLIAFLVSILLIILYISIRFEFKMSLCAIAALIHDLLIVVGVYAIFGKEVTPNVVAALLTIIGYSLYDTVVVFHRIKDNADPKMQHSFMSMANHSINQVFTRTINTTLTSLIPVLAMLFFGGATLQDFAFAMTIGLILGSYSSIGIAAPLYAIWKSKEPQYAKLAERYGDAVDTDEFKAAEFLK